MKKIISIVLIALSSALYAGENGVIVMPTGPERQTVLTKDQQCRYNREEYFKNPPCKVLHRMRKKGRWGVPSSDHYVLKEVPEQCPFVNNNVSSGNTEYFRRNIEVLLRAESTVNRIRRQAWSTWAVRIPTLIAGAATGLWAFTHILADKTKQTRIGGSIAAALGVGALAAQIFHYGVCKKNDVHAQERDIKAIAQLAKERWDLFINNPVEHDLSFRPSNIQESIQSVVSEAHKADTRFSLTGCKQTSALLNHMNLLVE